MKALVAAWKTLLEFVREPLLLAFVVLLPLAFLVVNAVGYSAPLLLTHPVWMLGDDERGTAFSAVLEQRRYPDGRPVYAVKRVQESAPALAALKDRTATALLAVPAGQAAGKPWRVTVSGDALSMNFVRASTLLNQDVQRFALQGRSPAVEIKERPLSTQGPTSFFEQYTPGMIVFGVLLIIPQTAWLVGREVRRGGLKRLRLTTLRTVDYFTGLTLAQMAVAVVQVVLVFLGAILLGFHNHGSLVLAILIGLTISFSSVGLGLVTACFVADDSQAINVGSVFSMLQVFLSGAFFAMPPMTVFNMAGHAIGPFDIFPATHGMLALSQVLLYGAGVSEIAFRWVATLVLSVVYFFVGVVVFGWLKMRR